MTKESKQTTKAFCCGSVKSGFERVHKKPFYSFLELFVRGKINYFFYKFLILLGCRSRSYIIMYMTFKSSYFGMITIPLEVRIVSGFVFTAIWIRLKNTHALGHCVIFSEQQGHRPPPPSPKSENAHTPMRSLENLFHSTSLHQDVTHGFDVLVFIIWAVLCLVSTRVVVIMFSSRSKPDSGVTVIAVVSIVSNDPDSCFWIEIRSTHNIEAFLVTVNLQGGL